MHINICRKILETMRILVVKVDLKFFKDFSEFFQISYINVTCLWELFHFYQIQCFLLSCSFMLGICPPPC